MYGFYMPSENKRIFSDGIMMPPNNMKRAFFRLLRSLPAPSSEKSEKIAVIYNKTMAQITSAL